MFAFKQIEALIQQKNSSLNLHLIIRPVGQKLTCSSENTPHQTKFFIDIPAWLSYKK